MPRPKGDRYTEAEAEATDVMQTLRIALAQINTTVGDLAGNAARILEYAQRAAASGADLVAFPELALTGYPPEDLLIRAPFIEDATRALEELADRADGLPPLIVGCVEFDRQLYNSAAVIHGGAARDLPQAFPPELWSLRRVPLLPAR